MFEGVCVGVVDGVGVYVGVFDGVGVGEISGLHGIIILEPSSCKM